jgi:hypothetical protein
MDTPLTREDFQLYMRMLTDTLISHHSESPAKAKDLVAQIYAQNLSLYYEALEEYTELVKFMLISFVQGRGLCDTVLFEKLFEAPLSEMPLYMDHKDHVVRFLVKWRLQIGR